MKVIIDRATWRTGRYGGVGNSHYGDAMLLNEQGFQCCLGFLGNSCELSKTDALNKLMPRAAPARWPIKLFSDSALTFPGSKNPVLWQRALADINDAEDVPDDIRESWVSDGFRIVLDCDVIFIGEYPKN